VDGNKITSEAQRQLYDDVKRGNCTRCHKGGHNRKDCKEPKAKWEEKFDKEKLLYWTSVHKWQQRASQPAEKSVTSKDPPKPPTLHIKPEQRLSTLAYDYSSEDEYEPLVHYRMTMPDPYPDDDDTEDAPLTVNYDVAAFTPPLTVAAILADVDRRLANHPADYATGDVETSSSAADGLERMDTHVRAILIGAQPRLSVLNTALGHDPSLFPGPTSSLPPLTDESITAHIAEIYAYYYNDSEEDDENLESEGHPRDDIAAAPVSPAIVPNPHLLHTPPADYPLVPRAPWMLEGDPRTDAEADADWRRAMTRLFPSATPPQESSSASSPAPHHRPPRPPLPHLGLPRTQWGDGPQVASPVVPPAALGWHMPTWGGINSDQTEHEPEPQSWGSRRPPSRSSSDSAHEDPDYDPSLYHYVQTRSSFQGGTTVNATAFVRDPLNTRHPLSTRPLLVGLDSYSDVTVASRDIVYNVRPVLEHLSTGGGDTEYTEEGLVDIVDGPCFFRTIPALVATQPAHLPQKCLLLLGVP
jgi:hypothetical protein